MYANMHTAAGGREIGWLGVASSTGRLGGTKTDSGARIFCGDWRYIGACALKIWRASSPGNP